jgi:hypothetical protein
MKHYPQIRNLKHADDAKHTYIQQIKQINSKNINGKDAVGLQP